MKFIKDIADIKLTNGDEYIILKDNADLYDWRLTDDNKQYLIKYDCRKIGWFVFKHWEDIEVNLGEIESMEFRDFKK